MIKNRKAPSSAARQPLITAEGVHITEIPLRKPDYKTKPADGTRTLLDIIEERRLLSTGEGGSLSTGEGGSLHVAVQEEEVELFGLGMNAFFFAVPLTILLFWLDVLVHLQYRHETDYAEIVARCAKAFPAIFAIHYLFHPQKDRLAVKLFLLAMSVAAGCYMVKAVNRFGYYMVMKRTPALGTLWIWAVIEMDLLGAVLSVAGVGAYTWYCGYGVL